jgi:hypothetical protein
MASFMTLFAEVAHKAAAEAIFFDIPMGQN